MAKGLSSTAPYGEPQRVALVDPTSGSPVASTAGWTIPALVTTNAGSATDILAAGLARGGLIIANESASEPCRIRWDGSDANSTTGLPLAAGAVLSFERGEVPAGKISGYSTNPATITVAYH